jgi:hypothetical protein
VNVLVEQKGPQSTQKGKQGAAPSGQAFEQQQRAHTQTQWKRNERDCKNVVLLTE